MLQAIIVVKVVELLNHTTKQSADHCRSIQHNELTEPVSYALYWTAFSAAREQH